MNSTRIPSFSVKSTALCACAMIGVTMLAVPAHADIRNWDGDTSVTWATAGNWDTLPVNDITTDIARFNLGAYTFQPNASTRSIAGLEIGSASGAVNITTTILSIGGSGITMEAGAAAASVGRFTVAANQTFTNSSSNTLTLNGANNTFTNQLTLSGSGRIAFTASGTITGGGGVVIDGAQVTIGNNNQFGVEANNNLLTLRSGSLSTLSRTLANQVSITGDFTFATNSTAANGLNSVANKTTTGNVILTTTVLSTHTTNGQISFTNGALQLGGNLELRNVLGGDTGLRVGTLNLTSGIDLGGANRTLTLAQVAGATNIGLLNLNGGNLLINGTGATPTTFNGGVNTNGVARSITFDNAGAGIPTLSGAFAGTASTLTIAGSSTNARIGALTGTSHAINVNSSTGGSFLFNDQSTYSGGTTVTNGVVTASVAGVAGISGPLGTGATIVNGGRLDSTLANALLGSSSVTVSGGELRGTAGSAFTNGGGGVTLNGGTLRGFNAGAVNYGGGAISVTGNSTIVNERSGPPSATSLNLTFGTSVSVGNSQLNITSTDNQTGGLSTITLGTGSLTGNGILNVTDNPAATNNTILALTTLTATGSGNQIAAGNGEVSVSGATSVGGTGTLLVNGNLTATGGVTVASNGTLGGSGVITGAVVIDGNLSPGNSPGLFATGPLTLNGGANSIFEINGLTRGTQFDAVNVTGLLTLGGTLTLDFGFTPDVSDTFDLFNFTTQTGSFSSVVFVDPGYAGSFDSTTGILALSAVPEPSTALMLLGGLGMTVLLRRRRA